MSQIGTKLTYMESLVNEYFLFDEEDEEEEGTGYSAEGLDLCRLYVLAETTHILLIIMRRNSPVSRKKPRGNTAASASRSARNVYTGLITVVKVFKDSPAEEAGMLPGDYLYKVEDLEATGEDLSILVSEPY